MFYIYVYIYFIQYKHHCKYINISIYYTHIYIEHIKYMPERSKKLTRSLLLYIIITIYFIYIIIYTHIHSIIYYNILK